MRRPIPKDSIDMQREDRDRIRKLELRAGGVEWPGIDHANFYLDSEVDFQSGWENTPSGAGVIGRTCRYTVMWPGLVLISGSVRSTSGTSIASLIGSDIFRMPARRNPYPPSQRFLVAAQKALGTYGNDTALIQLGDPALSGFFDLSPTHVPLRLLSTTITSLESGERLYLHLSGITWMQNNKPAVLGSGTNDDPLYVDYSTNEHVT